MVIVFKLDNSSGAISLSGKLQKCVSTFTSEVELNVVGEAIKEALHLANLLKEANIDVGQTLLIFHDNQVCIDLSKISMNHGKIKHFASELHSKLSQDQTKRAQLLAYRSNAGRHPNKSFEEIKSSTYP